LSDAVLFADWPAPANILAGTTTRSGGEADLPVGPQWLDQVHGTRAVVLGSADFGAGVPQADAVIGKQPGDICAIRTADCLPVLLCAQDGSEVAAVHAGWRGLAAGVIEATVARMSTDVCDLIAWLGPAIAMPAFEVGAEVREKFDAAGFNCEQRFAVNSRGRWQADLFGLAADRLTLIGVAEVFGERVCTFDDPGRFFSYRRDGATGRLLSFIQRQ
jgi:YfiH family protein